MEHMSLFTFFHLTVPLDMLNLHISHLDSLNQPFEGGVVSFQALLDLSQPHSPTVPLRQRLHSPEPLLAEDGSPLVLEEADQLKEVDRNAAFEAHAHDVRLRVEAACCHSAFHQHPLSGQMLADHHVHPVKPPDGELDRPAVETDHTHHVLIDVVDPIPRLKDFDSSCGFFQFLVNSLLELVHHLSPVNLALFHFKAEEHLLCFMKPWDVLEMLGFRGFHVELDGAFLILDRHFNSHRISLFTISWTVCAIWMSDVAAFKSSIK